MLKKILATAALSALAIGSTAIPSSAKAGDVVKAGTCTGSSTAKLKVGARDGGFETEWEVDSNRNGQSWTWKLRQRGVVKASGTAMTVAPSGSFNVERRLANPAGTDTIRARATNAATGEVCTAVVSI